MGVNGLPPAGLSEHEINLLALSYQCFTTEPVVDITKLAALGGYSNPQSCRNIMARIKGKLNAIASPKNAPEGQEEAVETPPASTGAKRGRKRKEPVASNENGDDQGGSPLPKAKRATKPRKIVPKVKPEDEEYDNENVDEESQTPTPVKKIASKAPNSKATTLEKNGAGNEKAPAGRKQTKVKASSPEVKVQPKDESEEPAEEQEFKEDPADAEDNDEDMV